MPASAATRLLAGGAPRVDASAVAPEDVVVRADAAGIRGRGGAGFPLAKKLSATRSAAALAEEAYVVANAYDADPDSPLSRTLLERNADAVLAGIALAARAVGASRSYLYLRPDAPAPRVGDGVEVVRGTGGFMGGEESALLAVLESRRAMARQRPPYPALQGLRLRPTLIASAESLAWLPYAMDGAKADTKLVSVTGAVRQPGVYEVALGTTLGDVLAQAGGVIGTLKGIHVGGPTGGILAAAKASVRLDFDALKAAGTHMGSAQVRAVADGVCMVNEAARLFGYLAQETCGICVPCRVGTKRVQGIYEGIYSGLGRADDVKWLLDLADHLEKFSLCGFGITSASIVRTTLSEFDGDVRAHLGGRCPTGTCSPARARRYETMVQP
ncbi:MAG TPA: NADH-ubiquinone oxidoreductase-F iron-sulfur binding region domain-containing protein [Candidatus Limnocylindria bacterium]|nr:NADH-ubiquinone oxidoreductase-F iron-sulfur binding region domain-containing protein [Candidatus Limnocylindria bacterium]